MRRALVLTDETARHPFLASLPPHVRGGTEPVRARTGWRLNAADIRGFFATYLASLVVIGAFIA
ncbi:MAG: hypothetical protein ACK4GD_12265 [Sphingomonadaceae bacterium]